jgi:predicted Fe-Mo cluster-binding NifX family protein
MAKQMGVPFLGRIPIEPQIVQACDSGRPFVFHYSKSKTAEAFQRTLNPILELDNDSRESTQPQSLQTGDKKMRIAIPLAQGKMSLHFGHCEEFAIVDVDEKTKEISNITELQPPAHQPGVLPRWLSEQKADVIIAGGMGQRAQQLFAQNNIKVVVGASEQTPEQLVKDYLSDTLETGDNICDH